MSGQGEPVVETPTGFVTGADPRQQPMTAAEWQAAQNSANQGPPITIVNQPPQNGAGRVFTEEEVARIRAEEKDKLYNRMSELEQQLGGLAEERERREEAERQAAEAAEAAERAKQEADMDVRSLLAERETEWERRFQDLQADREREKALREKEQQLAALSEYRRNRIEQEADDIMPELRDFITGFSPEEVDASIETMKHRTAAILASMQGAVTQQRQALRGAAVTAPPVGPMEQQTDLRTMTPDDLRNMDMGTYAKHRDSLLRAAGGNPGR